MELCVAAFLMWVVTQTRLSTFLDKDILVGPDRPFFNYLLFIKCYKKMLFKVVSDGSNLNLLSFRLTLRKFRQHCTVFWRYVLDFNRFPSANLVNISWEKLQKPFDKCTRIQLWMKLFFLETRGYLAKKFSSKDMGETSCFLRSLRLLYWTKNEEILNGKLHFLFSANHVTERFQSINLRKLKRWIVGENWMVWNILWVYVEESEYVTLLKKNEVFH